MSRTIRRSYTKSKRFDVTCRSHGGCPYCERNRLFSNAKRSKTKSIRRNKEKNWLKFEG